MPEVPATITPGVTPTSFLGRIPARDRERLLALGRTGGAGVGTVLLQQGETPRVLRVLLIGTAEASHASEDGHMVRLGSYGPGDAVGLPEACAGGAALATVRVARAAQVLDLPLALLRRSRLAIPSVTEAVVRSLASRVRDAENHWVDTAFVDTRVLLCRWILRFAEIVGVPAQHGPSVTFHCSQSELASWAGLSREAVVKHLHALRAQGLVTTGRMSLTVLDPGRLRAQVEG